MISNEKLRPYIFAFLLFCVLSSKNIIIYNEETLVALSFVLFVYFVFYYFGNNIKDSLDERSETIKAELQNFLKLKKSSLESLYAEHKKVAKLGEILSQVSFFTIGEVKEMDRSGKEGLYAGISSQFLNRLRTLSEELLSSLLQQKVQEVIATRLLDAVLVKRTEDRTTKKKSTFSHKRKGSKFRKAIDNTIHLLLSSNKR